MLNNSSVMLALAESKRNSNAVNKSLNKLTTGMKVNQASDDSAGYAISEKMRVMIRALDQDCDNVKKGMTLLKTAEGGIQEIVNSLRNMKELALNSANDHNSNVDREILQKDFLSLKNNIDDIAATTNYNNKLLLDGRWSKYNKEVLSECKIEDATVDDLASAEDVPPELASIYAFESYIKSEIDREDLPLTGCTSDVRPIGDAEYIKYGNTIEITSDGVFVLPATPWNIVVKAQNVEIVGNGTVCKNYFINSLNSNTKIWINSIDIVSTLEKPIIKFAGSGNSLNLIGKNKLETQVIKTYHNALGFTCDSIPIVDVGDELVINNGTNKEGVLYIPNNHQMMRKYGGIGTSNNPRADIIINSGTIGISCDAGAPIGAAAASDVYNAYVGNITINGGYVLASTRDGAAIGAGGATNDWNHRESLYYNKSVPTWLNSGAGNIYIGSQAIVDVFSEAGAGIGTSGYQVKWFMGTKYGSNNSRVGNITIASDNVRAYSVLGEALGSGAGIEGRHGDYVYNEYNAIVGTIDANESKYRKSFLDGNMEVHYHLYDGRTDASTSYSNEQDEEKLNIDGNPLVIHYGDKANQNMYVYINDMHVSALGLDAVAVNPREAAIDALGKIDKAIEYALEECTQMGTYQSRLRYTLNNIICNNENIVSAESVIRDADMAMTLVAYAKESLLTESSLAFLAQANQEARDVISLLP